MVMNLAGRSVNCRYTKANRRAILDSRVQSTRVVGEAIAGAVRPPRVWLQAATATIYAHRFDAPNDEHSGIIGGTEPCAPETWRFSIDVATAWEKALATANTPRTRKVALRSAMTMSPDRGGVFDVLLGLVRRGLGGRVGDGTQFVSWIHDRDFIRAVEFLIETRTEWPDESRRPRTAAECRVHAGIACGMGNPIRATSDAVDGSAWDVVVADRVRTGPEESPRRAGPPAERRIPVPVPLLARGRNGSVPPLAGGPGPFGYILRGCLITRRSHPQSAPFGTDLRARFAQSNRSGYNNETCCDRIRNGHGSCSLAFAGSTESTVPTPRRETVFATRTLALLAISAIALTASHGSGQQKGKPDVPSQPNEAMVMQVKLKRRQALLEALAKEDYKALEENADSLVRISDSTAFMRAYKTDEYELEARVFRRAAATLAAKAKDRRLDGATLAYTEMTLSCVRCHNHFRGLKKKD